MSKIVLLNKPFNVLCQFTDDKGRLTLAHYLDMKGVYPAGRLDYDSEGLVVLTDNGKLQHQISHPRTKLAKTYWVQVEGTPTQRDITALKTGLTLKDGPCRATRACLIDAPPCWPREPPVRARKKIPTHWLEITLTEGRNRQVRRMTAAVGLPTLRLIRASVGQWTINGIAPGHYKVLTVHARQSRSHKLRHIPGQRTPV